MNSSMIAWLMSYVSVLAAAIITTIRAGMPEINYFLVSKKSTINFGIFLCIP